MIQMTLSQAATILGLPLPTKDVTFQGISTDTRSLKPGNLFVAITGAKIDGHDLLETAQQQGAQAALVNRPIQSNLPQLIVPDAAQALGQLAAAWRKQFNLPIIAVTGSSGKTTLKNMIAAILKAACFPHPDQALANQGNLNNHFGVPLTLAQLNKNHRYAVIEMGMNHFGEIKHLTEITRPTVAIISNAGPAHLEGVGSLAGVAKAKAEIFLGLPENGIAILNRDDAFFDFWRKEIGKHTFLSFGFHPDADVRTDLPLSTSTNIHTPKGNFTVQIPLLGQHNVLNALAATAAALAINIELTAIKTGLEAIAPEKGRLQIYELTDGIKVIDDSYNANPLSLQAAVETLATFSGKKILILGDMRELGEEAENLHRAAGENIRQAGIDYLFTFGELTAHTSECFGEGAYHFQAQEQLVNALKPFLHPQTTVLVKGSRSMRMEKIVADLKAGVA